MSTLYRMSELDMSYFLSPWSPGGVGGGSWNTLMCIAVCPSTQLWMDVSFIHHCFCRCPRTYRVRHADTLFISTTYHDLMCTFRIPNLQSGGRVGPGMHTYAWPPAPRPGFGWLFQHPPLHFCESPKNTMEMIYCWYFISRTTFTSVHFRGIVPIYWSASTWTYLFIIYLFIMVLNNQFLTW